MPAGEVVGDLVVVPSVLADTVEQGREPLPQRRFAHGISLPRRLVAVGARARRQSLDRRERCPRQLSAPAPSRARPPKSTPPPPPASPLRPAGRSPQLCGRTAGRASGAQGALVVRAQWRKPCRPSSISRCRDRPRRPWAAAKCSDFEPAAGQPLEATRHRRQPARLRFVRGVRSAARIPRRLSAVRTAGAAAGMPRRRWAVVVGRGAASADLGLGTGGDLTSIGDNRSATPFTGAKAGTIPSSSQRTPRSATRNISKTIRQRITMASG